MSAPHPGTGVIGNGWRIGPISAVLFDLDGVLVDSQDAIDWSMTTWATERGLDPAMVLDAAHGRRDVDIVMYTLPGCDPGPELARIAQLDQQALPMIRAIAGAADLAATLPTGAWAVVTSGARPIANARLRAVGLPVPGLLIGAEDVAHGKPHPEGYLLAADRLGIPPRECVVFEDTAVGLRAARRAGTRPVRVGGPPGRRHEAWVRDLSGVRVALSAGPGTRYTVEYRPSIGGADQRPASAGRSGGWRWS